MATRSSLSSKKSLDLWLLHVHWIRALSQRCQDSPWGMFEFSYLTLEKKCFACLSLVQTDQESFREMVIPRILSESSSSTAFALKFLSPSCVGLDKCLPGPSAWRSRWHRMCPGASVPLSLPLPLGNLAVQERKDSSRPVFAFAKERSLTIDIIGRAAS